MSETVTITNTEEVASSNAAEVSVAAVAETASSATVAAAAASEATEAAAAAEHAADVATEVATEVVTITAEMFGTFQVGVNSRFEAMADVLDGLANRVAVLEIAETEPETEVVETTAVTEAATSDETHEIIPAETQAMLATSRRRRFRHI
jgi:hypothetical protein